MAANEEGSWYMRGAMHRRALAVAAVMVVLLGLLVLGMPGAASAGGLAFVHFDGTQTCFTVNWRNLAAPTRAHIHQGASGVAGPIVLPFFEGEVPAPISSAHGCVTGGQDLIQDIRSHPDQFYVNVHNADFPAGAMRGQLRPFPVVPRTPTQLSASLLGSNEVPPADQDGSFFLRIRRPPRSTL